MKASYLNKEKINVGIFGFTGCAGDQLVIIHDEDRILEYFGGAEIRSFIMASSDFDNDCDLDVALVEGSINTTHEIEELKKIRGRSKILVAIGTCAVHGGMQAGVDGTWREMYHRIYGDLVTLTTALEPKPLSFYVNVDANIPGCPITKDQIYYAFAKLAHGIIPEEQNLPVCYTCRLKENICLLEKNKLCLGPITAGGCDAACPSNNVVCMGCFGLYEGANIKGFVTKAALMGFERDEIVRRMICHGGVTTRDKLEEEKI